jgi:cell wall-associated NlpC family hydrolase
LVVCACGGGPVKTRTPAPKGDDGGAGGAPEPTGGTGGNGGTGSGSGPRPPVPPVSGAARIAVAFALAQVGKPYQYGAAGPNVYDCSGLTMRAWGAAGVGLPHSAAAQYGIGVHVTRAELQPGDLAFFYSPISHVAMYIGNNQMVDATHTGSYVLVQTLRPAVGFTRPTG